MSYTDRRYMIKKDFGDKGYKLCKVTLSYRAKNTYEDKLCNTPIRDNLFQDTNGNIRQGKGLMPVELKVMCEVCYIEFGGTIPFIDGVIGDTDVSPDPEVLLEL